MRSALFYLIEKKRHHSCAIRLYVHKASSFLVLSFLCIITGCASPPIEQEPLFYPPLPELPRLQFLTAISSEEDLETNRSDFINFLLGPEITAATLGRPYDLASTPGKIYVVDRRFNTLIKIDLTTQDFQIIGRDLSGVIQGPAGITTDAGGRKYVADMDRKEVIVFDGDDNFIKVYGGQDVLEKPVDVAVWNNLLYVCDIIKNQVVVFDLELGKQVKTIGGIGKEQGEFYKPTHIFVDESGNLFVNDSFNYRVQKLSADGTFESAFGFHGDAIGAMARSKGIAVDRNGNLYVADAAFEYVQIFDGRGRLLLFFGGPGIKRGNLYLPGGIHIDYDNIPYFSKFADDRFKIKYLLYVCNMSGPNKINVYGFGEWLDE